MVFIFAAALFLQPPKIVFDPKPYAIVYTPNSILQTPPPDSYLRYAETQPRFSTCGGVAWFQGSKYLFAVNMQTSSIQIYEFCENAKKLTPVRKVTNEDGLDLLRPENICISQDGTLIAIPNMGNGKLQIYSVAEGAFINPMPLATIQSYKLHGARFSPDGKTVSYTGFGNQSGIHTANLVPIWGELRLDPIQMIPNPFEPLKPKSIDFSPDGRFAAIGYCTQLTRQKGGVSLGILATYHRDPKTGQIDPSPIACREGLSSLETVAFYPDSSFILAVDQVNNRVTGHGFDQATGELGGNWIALENPEAELNFCHGVSITSDGKYVAVSNYGDDKITVYKRL